MSPLTRFPQARPYLVMAVGSVFLALAFFSAERPVLFVLCSLAVAVTWICGGLLLRRGANEGGVPWSSRPAVRHPWALTVAAAAAVVVVFLGGTWVLKQLPFTAQMIDAAASAASWTPLWLTVTVATVTGWGEEVFFRWALPPRWGRHGSWWALLAYTLCTVFTGNLVLVMAAPLLGFVCQVVLTRTQRLVAACAVHTAFSLGVVGLVPLLF